MTTPRNVPLRVELTFELPGTPEQVWEAIATADGISSWFLPTDVEEREGGAIVAHMGEEADSPGAVTGWEPPRRFAYSEPEWAALTGREVDSVTPLVTEFLVEAQSGGGCVVRVVSSAFGTGADWERELFADMERRWSPFFHHLRLYLACFPGQRVTSLEAGADVSGSAQAVLSAVREALGVGEVGQPVEVCGLTGQVERISDIQLLVRLDDPVPGFVAFGAFDKGDGVAAARSRAICSPRTPPATSSASSRHGMPGCRACRSLRPDGRATANRSSAATTRVRRRVETAGDSFPSDPRENVARDCPVRCWPVSFLHPLGN